MSFKEMRVVLHPRELKYAKNDFPLCLGLPLAPGVSAEQLADLQLCSDSGPIPQSSSMPVARWSDGSIRWVWIEILADLSNNQRLELVTKSELLQIPSLPGLQCVALAKPNNGHLEFQIQDS